MDTSKDPKDLILLIARELCFFAKCIVSQHGKSKFLPTVDQRVHLAWCGNLFSSYMMNGVTVIEVPNQYERWLCVYVHGFLNISFQRELNIHIKG